MREQEAAGLLRCLPEPGGRRRLVCAHFRVGLSATEGPVQSACSAKPGRQLGQRRMFLALMTDEPMQVGGYLVGENF
jgi:hypothetical protein